MASGHIALVDNAFLFVDFFFVLSGFVIASSYAEKLAGGYRIRDFMQLRFARIYPLHAFMLFMFFLMEVGVALLHRGGSYGREPFSGLFMPQDLLSSLTLTQIVFSHDRMAWNFPSWSIAAEMWTYLAFAALVGFLPRRAGATCMLIALAGPLILPLLSDYGMNVIHGPGAIVRCLSGFALGVLAYKWSTAALRPELGRWQSTAIELAALLAVILFVSAYGRSPVSYGAPYLFLAAILVFVRQGGMVSGLLARKWATGLGALSYSIYMVHMFLLYRFRQVAEKVSGFTGHDLLAGDNPLLIAGMGALFLALVLLCASLANRFVERPAQAFLRRQFDERRQPLVAAP